jgi:hypothetical protein
LNPIAACRASEKVGRWIGITIVNPYERSIAFPAHGPIRAGLQEASVDHAEHFTAWWFLVQELLSEIAYWNYIMPEMEHLEKKWIEERDKAADAKPASAVGLKNTETR